MDDLARGAMASLIACMAHFTQKGKIMLINHLKDHAGKYVSILGIFPLIFLANIAMPSYMQFATAAQSNSTDCKIAWINYEISMERLEAAEFRADTDPSMINRSAVTKYEVEVEQALQSIDRYCG
tara:strand:- start:239 stop:613 length:375 start_codon:yes stop_codon:yes gene_type:complete